jgi:hypothetical protein
MPRLARYIDVTGKRVPGAMKGRIVIHEDFDELPPDFAAAFGLETSGSCSTGKHRGRRE